MDCPVGSNSAQQNAFSEKSRDGATCAPIPPPRMYRSNLLRHSGSAKYPSASIAFQQSSRDTWSPRQSVVKHDQHTAQRVMHRMSGPTQQDRGFAWQANVSQRQKSNLPVLHNMEVDMRWQEETPPSQKSVKKPVEMTLYRALNLLKDFDEERLISAAKYIQTQCFQEDEPRNTVFIMNGVEKLLPLLKNDSEEVQCAAAGALRNVVYMNNKSKEVVKETEGLPVILKALANTRNKETISHLAALLWNLSSDDTIKELFNTKFLNIITKSAVVPGSGMSVAENPKDEMIGDPKAFYFATGCLRWEIQFVWIHLWKENEHNFFLYSILCNPIPFSRFLSFILFFALFPPCLFFLVSFLFPSYFVVNVFHPAIYPSIHPPS
ncbi:hypothetical protein ATANTOWER_020583 [Ataeniobius toweri]|uniref:Plakophilin 2 n=1 Tax=Ataeniobius toweri TaxID=208326 RepID=A0ABU7B8N0_9TELE|nr:hypothetical protein [Ataeniobius toweri]